MTVDIAKAVGEAKRGRVEFKMDKTAIVHVGLGKVQCYFSHYMISLTGI